VYSAKRTEVNAKLASHTDLVDRAARTSAAEAAAEEAQRIAAAEVELRRVVESRLAELMGLQQR